MSGIIINTEACVGCKKCLKVCSQNAIRVENKKAVVNDNCIMCGICLDSCPKQAISMERKEAETAKLAQDCQDIWVFAEQNRGVLQPVALELLGKGRELADQKGCRLVALLGEGQDYGNRQLLLASGADEVIYCQDQRLDQHHADMYIRWLYDLVKERKPEILLFGATVFGRELAPGLAVRLQAGLTADCTVLEIDPETGLLRQTRPAFGGNLMATIVCPNTRPQMATVRPGVFKGSGMNPDAILAETKGSMHLTRTFLAEGVSPLVEIIEEVKEAETESIAKAEIIVDVGRGIGSKKNLKLMKEFADLIGGQLGCSRPLVESGWCQYRHQVGQTGSTVSPRILYCIGISGAIQHLAGIGGAETIIAINNDPTAPIFGVSTYSVVGDCVEIIRAAVEELKSQT